MSDLSKAFVAESIGFLRSEFLPRIRECVTMLREEDVWWRPNEQSNSIGNLILHLTGNVRQWIGTGLGDVPDTRDRKQEFDFRGTRSADDLLRDLTDAVEEAVEVLERLPEHALLERRTIRGREVTGLHAVYHVVEHFSMHAGQILYVCKLRLGRDLELDRLIEGHPAAGRTQPGFSEL
jgi:uncharacterized damage-inducible protein DinB